MSVAKLRAQVFAAPDDLAVKQVYADALIESGDPRGEFIRRQCEGQTAAADKLLRKHERAWLAAIRKHVISVQWRHGFVYRVETNELRWVMGWKGLVAAEPIRRVAITG